MGHFLDDCGFGIMDHQKQWAVPDDASMLMFSINNIYHLRLAVHEDEVRMVEMSLGLQVSDRKLKNWMNRIHLLVLLEDKSGDNQRD